MAEGLDAARAGAHLLAVPDGVTPADIEALVRSRFPEAGLVLADGGARQVIEVLPGCAIDGPWAPPASSLPEWVGQVYLLLAPEVRGGPVPAELRGRGDLLDAFADGEPVAEERQVIELALSVARRVGGALRVGGPDGMLLAPAPLPDLIVYSEVWLDPDALLHVLEPHLPGLELEGETTPAATPADAVTGESLVADESERRWLHAEADAYDAAMLAEPAVTESYGAQARRADGAIFSVTVEAAVGIPVVLSGLDWTGPILYELRCHPAGSVDTSPPADSVERIDAAARALLAAVGGHVVDDDGFLVDLRG